MGLLGEMTKLPELSALISDILKEWQDKETLDLIGDQVWDDLTEEWAEFIVWGRQQPCLVNVDVLDLLWNRHGWRE